LLEVINHGSLASALERRLAGVPLHAPALIDLEVLHTLRRKVFGGSVTVEAAEAAIAEYRSVRIERYPHDNFIDRIWQLRVNFSAYDAVYVALAETLRAPLITLDARLAKSAPPTCRVELFA
jgi:predicted nucleic acid-binding protein